MELKDFPDAFFRARPFGSVEYLSDDLRVVVKDHIDRLEAAEAEIVRLRGVISDLENDIWETSMGDDL